MLEFISSLQEAIFASIALNKVAGIFIIIMGLYNLHLHCIRCKEPKHVFHKLLREKMGHERELNANLFLSTCVIILGTWSLLI